MKAKAYIVHQAMCEPELEWSKPRDCLSAEPLYTAQPQRTWVDLTDEEIQVVAKQARSKDHAVTLTNKLLKEKNA